MEHMNETELISQILNGNTQAFSILVCRYQRLLHALIGQMVSNREDAEELTQDVFIKAFSKLDSFRGQSNLSTWLYRIAYNTAITFLRKKKPPCRVYDEKVWNNLPDETVDELLNKENDEVVLQQLESALNLLLPEERALIALYYSREQSVSEVSVITGLTRENVKVKLFRIRKKIVFLIKSNQNGPG